MSLKKTNLLFLHDEKSNQVTMANFLKSQVGTLHVAHALGDASARLRETHIILIKELGDVQTLKQFSQNAIRLNPNIRLILIEKLEKLDVYKQNLKDLFHAFVSLPINKKDFLQVLADNTPSTAAVKSSNLEDDALLRTILLLQKNLFFLLKEGALVYRSPYMEETLVSTDIVKLYTSHDHPKDYFSLPELPDQHFHFVTQVGEHDKFDTLVTLESVDLIDYDPSDSDILSKEDFYTYLQSQIKLLEPEEQFTLCEISLVNQTDMEKQYGGAKVIATLHQLMHHLLQYISDGKISFWYDRALLFSLSSNFDDAKQRIQTIQSDITKTAKKYNIPIRVAITATSIKHNDTMDHCLEKIDRLYETSSNAYSDIYVASYYNDIQNDNTKVISMLQDVLNDSASSNSLSLTSFYKGLIINNNIFNASISDDGVLSFNTEVVQCLAMSMESQVLLHSALMPNDIACQVKLANHKDKSGKIHKYKILSTSYKQRKFSRIVPEKNTAITLAIGKINVAGMVLDISMNSISALVTNELIQNYHQDTKLTASMNLVMKELQRSERVKFFARIITVVPADGGFKVVIGLEDNEEAVMTALADYLKIRKKEIVLELKNLVKVNQ